jgi:hypothetical protein
LDGQWRYGDEGAKVFINDIVPDLVNVIVDEIKPARGLVLGVPGDASDLRPDVRRSEPP